jgi:hypothetical protein
MHAIIAIPLRCPLPYRLTLHFRPNTEGKELLPQELAGGAVAGLNARWRLYRYGAHFRQKFTLEDAIGSYACSREASRRVTNDIPLGCLLTSSHCKLRPNTEGTDKTQCTDRTWMVHGLGQD